MLSKISTRVLSSNTLAPSQKALFGVAPSKKPAVDPAQYGRRLDEHDEPRFLEQVKYFIERAARTTDVPDDYMEIITTCNATLRLNLPLVRDDGTIENVTAYRA